MRALVLAGMLVLAVACTKEGAGPSDPSQAPEQAAAPADPQLAGPQAVENQINWEAARADLSKRPADAPVTIQTAGQDGPSPVPMLLPGIVSAQGAGQNPTIPVVTKDGYFATYHLPRYDAIVNGSQHAIASGQAAQGDKTEMRFTTGEASAQLAFSRYGADYVIEFECREVDGAQSCITEPEAKEFADGLFVAQTR
ncbi:MAG TPA: hypothetical protein VFV70_09920 [Hyphomonadaceae bacterium]|nr:hypothetical protein [Hyphomonadaceae bacterium]